MHETLSLRVSIKSLAHSASPWGQQDINMSRPLRFPAAAASCLVCAAHPSKNTKSTHKQHSSRLLLPVTYCCRACCGALVTAQSSILEQSWAQKDTLMAATRCAALAYQLGGTSSTAAIMSSYDAVTLHWKNRYVPCCCRYPLH
jgi:hypothetical protein